MIRRPIPLALAAAAALAGCNLAPTYVRPAAPVPAALPEGGVYPLRNGEAPAAIDWREVFRDPRLQALIAAALAENRDLRTALANVEAARAQYRIARADLFPAVSASAGYARGGSRSSGATTTTRGTTTGTTTGPTTGTGTGTGGTTITATSGGRDYQTYSLQGGITSWEIDLFGRLRNLTQAQFQSFLATDAGARATRLTLVADTASAWLTYAADRDLLAAAEQTAESARQSVALTDRRRAGGIASAVDVEQARTVLATALSDVATQRTQVAQDRNALDLLVGRPAADAELPRGLDDVAPLGEVPAGLSSTILLRRPDVVQAERNLIAANANIGAARAAFFPTISLTAIAGLASGALSSLFSGGAFNWSVNPQATLPIFQGGALTGNLEYARAERDAYLATYEGTIQTAFQEVADALATRGTIDDRLAAQRQLVAASERTFRLTNQRYRTGIDTFLSALDAQRTLYQAQQSLVTARLAEADNLVTLYRVLGGDQLITVADRENR